MGSYSVHKCDPNGSPLGALDGPAYAVPGEPVQLDSGLFGRVRLVWHCCGALLVECMSAPDDLDCPDTYTTRVTIPEVQPIPWGTPFSVPCVGAAWSLDLPCGHITGEGCDCDTIAAEAASQD